MGTSVTKPYLNGSGNSDFVPSWMADLGVKPTGWLNLSKAQLRSQQRPDKPLKVRIWATGMLHSPGYQGQEATTMRKGKKVPLTSGAIIDELFQIAKEYYTGAGIKPTDAELAALKEDKEHVRRRMADLEAEGVALRTDGDGTPLRDLSPEKLRRLPSGRTRMFFWVTPRAADPALVLREWQQRQPSAPEPGEPENLEVPLQGLPLPPISQILKGLKIGDSEAAQIRGKIADPEYQKTVERAWHSAREIFLEVVSAGGPQAPAERPPQVANGGGAFESKGERYKEERAPAAARSASPSPPSAFIQTPPSSSSAFSSPRNAKAEEEESDLFHIFKSEYPAGHFDGPKAKPSFDAKTKAEQLHAIERLRVYKKSERWKDDDGSWIPFASKWLASAYSEEPPPVVKKKSRTASAGNGSGEESYFERRVREEREGSNG